MKDIIAIVLGFVGIILMAGSAGDCDGACMDQANTLGEMMALAGAGLGMVLASVLVWKWGE